MFLIIGFIYCKLFFFYIAFALPHFSETDYLIIFCYFLFSSFLLWVLCHVIRVTQSDNVRPFPSIFIIIYKLFVPAYFNTKLLRVHFRKENSRFFKIAFVVSTEKRAVLFIWIQRYRDLINNILPCLFFFFRVIWMLWFLEHLQQYSKSFTIYHLHACNLSPAPSK